MTSVKVKTEGNISIDETTVKVNEVVSFSLNKNKEYLKVAENGSGFYYTDLSRDDLYRIIKGLNFLYNKIHK